MSQHTKQEPIHDKTWRAPRGHVTFAQETLNDRTVWVASDGDGVIAISDTRASIDDHLAAQQK